MTDTKYEPADIEIYVKNKGLVLKEKSLVAFDPYSKKILGIGDEAQALAAQDLESVAVQSPLRQGLVADYTMADRMFRHMLQKAYGKKRFFKPNIAVGGIPRNITEVEKKAFEDLMFQIGARMVTIFECSYEKYKKELELASAETLPKKDLSAVRSFLELDLENVYSSLSPQEKRSLWGSIINKIIIDNSRNIEFIFF